MAISTTSKRLTLEARPASAGQQYYRRQNHGAVTAFQPERAAMFRWTEGRIDCLSSLVRADHPAAVIVGAIAVRCRGEYYALNLQKRNE